MNLPLPPMPPTPPLPSSSLLPPIVPPLAGPSVGMPVGAVIAFAGPLAANVAALESSGWMVCDGRRLDKDEFDELFGAIGYVYSQSAGGQSFQIPNLQGYFLRGVDPSGQVDRDLASRRAVSGQGSTGVGSIEQCAFQLHEHQLAAATAVATPSQSGTEAGTTTTQTQNTLQVVAEPGASEPVQTSAFETRPINVSMYFIIHFATLGARPA